jgi:hypothetical protein
LMRAVCARERNTVSKKRMEIMNNYELANVTEIGQAANVIQGAKIWVVNFIDSQGWIDALDLWVANDLDETDD